MVLEYQKVTRVCFMSQVISLLLHLLEVDSSKNLVLVCMLVELSTCYATG